MLRWRRHFCSPPFRLMTNPCEAARRLFDAFQYMCAMKKYSQQTQATRNIIILFSSLCGKIRARHVMHAVVTKIRVNTRCTIRLSIYRRCRGWWALSSAEHTRLWSSNIWHSSPLLYRVATCISFYIKPSDFHLSEFQL